MNTTKATNITKSIPNRSEEMVYNYPGGGGGVLPYKGLMGTCGQPGYVFRDFCLEQSIEFIIFCLNQGIDLSIFVLNWVKCLKQGIKNRNSVLKWVGKSAIFVLNRVRV